MKGSCGSGMCGVRCGVVESGCAIVGNDACWMDKQIGE